MSKVIPVRVPRDTAERISRLVKLGVFPNRSSLVREALRRLLRSEESISRETPLRKIASLVS
ncbi:MAG: ribbon-helix-helix domain-containing protein, partial [Candidatus Bathyarchaeia archaeon]